jgi:hypothetical protein
LGIVSFAHNGLWDGSRMINATNAPFRALKMEDVIDLQRLCIPLERTVSVVPGPVDVTILSKLEEHSFDQAPVYDPTKDTYWGLIETTYLRSLFESAQFVREDDPIIRNENQEFHVGSFVTIFALLEKMTTQRAVVVMQDSDATEYGHARFMWGLFTISDLNRHAVRSAIHHLLADVEAGLAKWLETLVTDPWEWLKQLEEEQQARVLGYWELSKRLGVDVGPYAALTLSQLVNIISRHRNAAEKLGYESRSQFDKAKGRLPHLRNRVMHPVRPLVLTHADVASINGSVLTLETLRERVKALLGKDRAV